jgi:hypothetical protein
MDSQNSDRCHAVLAAEAAQTETADQTKGRRQRGKTRTTKPIRTVSDRERR